MSRYTHVLVGSAFLLAALPAHAEDAPYSDGAIFKRLDSLQHTMEVQQQQIAAQRGEIAALKAELKKKSQQAVPAAPPAATEPGLKADVDAQKAALADLSVKIAALDDRTKPAKTDQPVWSLAGGRPTITSADGRFSLAIRVFGQYDTAYYMQDAAARQLAPANGPDLSSGANWRRAALGVQGKVFGDWNYLFNYDFGGGAWGGNEVNGRIQAAYIEFAGWAPLAVRFGAFPPSANFDDAASGADSVFFERTAPAEMQRSMVGGDGRDAIAVTYTTDKLFASVAYTGGKSTDSALYFDEQQGLLARVAGLAYADRDWNVAGSASVSYLLRGPDATAGAGSVRNVTLTAMPELTADDNTTKLVSTSAINTKTAWNFSLEGAAAWRNVYAQGGYFGYRVDPAAGPALTFDGWYTELSWIFTGERRSYLKPCAAFGGVKPDKPFSIETWDLGAFELAARFSDLNLNDRAGFSGAPVPVGGVRGGEQRILTAGLNWYPNSAVKLALQYQHVDVNRLGTIPAGFGHGVLNDAQVGQTYDTAAFRVQLSL